MRTLFLLLIFPFSGSVYGQKSLELVEAGIQITNATTKFYQITAPNIRFYNRKMPVNMNKTIFCIDAMPTLKVYVNKNINFLAGAGFEIHRVKNDFIDNSANAANNFLWKIYAGGEIFVLGNRRSLINLRFQTIMTFEDLIINNTGFYKAIGTFNSNYVFDYANNPYRLGLDILPIINMNLNDKTSINFGIGYSFGLNKSNKRAITLERTWPSSTAQIIYDEKESSFIFSAGVYYNLSKTNRRSFKNWKFSELTNKMFYNQ